MTAIKKTTKSLNDEWMSFMYATNSSSSDDEPDETIIDREKQRNENNTEESVERCVTPHLNSSTELYISTKSKIAYLNQPINLTRAFWGVKIIAYALPMNGVIKKQMKFNSDTIEDVDILKENLKNENYIEEHVMVSINNPTGRIKFKDTRKISIGVSKKDLLSFRCKKKSAFYNCFVMILRLKIEECFKEFHVKVFNTGKMEIPGVQTEQIYELVLLNVAEILKPFIETDIPLEYTKKSDTVLVNSNFNCGYYINREVCVTLLKYKYNIQCIYDPCSYPGIQCKFFYNRDRNIKEQTGSQVSKSDFEKYKNIVTVSFMVFRTGSVLIVGMCDDEILYCIYEFLKNMFIIEFETIHQSIKEDETINKYKKKSNRRKIVDIYTDI